MEIKKYLQTLTFILCGVLVALGIGGNDMATACTGDGDCHCEANDPMPGQGSDYCWSDPNGPGFKYCNDRTGSGTTGPKHCVRTDAFLSINACVCKKR